MAYSWKPVKTPKWMLCTVWKEFLCPKTSEQQQMYCCIRETSLFWISVCSTERHTIGIKFFSSYPGPWASSLTFCSLYFSCLKANTRDIERREHYKKRKSHLAQSLWLARNSTMLVFFHAPQAPPFPETIYVIPHLLLSNVFQMVSFVRNGFASAPQFFPSFFVFRLLPLSFKPL